jgi:thiol-disulfide isomerase/thioredoxin
MKLLFSFVLGIVTFIPEFSSAQSIKSVKFEELNQIIRSEDGSSVKVVNFWATWCKPCIEELPYFEKLQETYGGKDVQVLLVSLDFSADKASAYKSKKDIQSEVVFLDETDHNRWIDKISPQWSGAIPATLIVDTRTGKEQFFEQKFEEKELFSTIEKFIN